MIGPDRNAASLRLALLLEQWDRSGNRVRMKCADAVREVVEADDVLGAFVRALSETRRRAGAGQLDELVDLRRLVRLIETTDFGGLTQRDADTIADAVWAAGYRPAPAGCTGRHDDTEAKHERGRP